jgi:hypothetical protein
MGSVTIFIVMLIVVMRCVVAPIIVVAEVFFADENALNIDHVNLFQDEQMQIVTMPGVTFCQCYAHHCNAECHYAEFWKML